MFKIDKDTWAQAGHWRYGIWWDAEGFHIGWKNADYSITW